MLPIIPARLMIAACLSVTLGACSTTVFRLEKAAAAPLDKVATIVISKVALRYVDDRIFDLCGMDDGMCAVQVLPGEHRLRYNIFTTEVIKERGRGYNRNSLHNRISRVKFEQSVSLKEGMVYELSFDESHVAQLKPYQPMETMKGELQKNIKFRAYEEEARAKILKRIRKSKIIRTSEYRPGI